MKIKTKIWISMLTFKMSISTSSPLQIQRSSKSELSDVTFVMWFIYIIKNKKTIKNENTF